VGSSHHVDVVDSDRGARDDSPHGFEQQVSGRGPDVVQCGSGVVDLAAGCEEGGAHPWCVGTPSGVGVHGGDSFGFLVASDTVTHLACLDVLPTLDMWEVMHGTSAAVGFHLYLMAQPPGLPEQMISASAEAFFSHFLDQWTDDQTAIPADIRAAYLDACRNAVPSMVADYRASATVDVDHDRIDRAAGTRLAMPVTVLQQDWGAALGYDATALWSSWAPDLEHRTVTSGHFMAEEVPSDIAAALRDLMRR